jgi:hypothetical protein
MQSIQKHNHYTTSIKIQRKNKIKKLFLCNLHSRKEKEKKTQFFMQQKSLALGYTVACMSSSLGYTLGTLPLYHTIYLGARDLPYRKKIVVLYQE